MSDKYSLPCECGQSVAIGISQAGQQVTCTCGRTLAVPTLRAMRQLEPIADSRPAVAGWNPVKGFIFGVGALLLVLGSVMAIHSYYLYSNVAGFKPSEEQYDQALAMIDQLDAEKMFEGWKFVKQHGLEEAGSSEYAMAQGIAKDKLRQTYIGSSIAVVGLVITLISLVLPTR